MKRRAAVGLLAAALLAVAVAAAVLLTAPSRAERRLETASLPELQALAREAPDDPRLLYRLGRRLEEAGEPEQAETAYWRAVERAPDEEAYWSAWSRLAAGVLGAQAAHDRLDAFLKENPGSARGHLMMASLLQASGYHRSALEAAVKATDLDSRLTQGWQVRGAAALAEEDYAEAEEAFRRAVALAPGDGPTRAALGEVLFLVKKHDEAREAFAEAVRLSEGDATVQLQMGRFLLATARSPADLDAAERHLLRAVEREGALSPEGRRTAYLSLGQCLARQDRWPQARNWLERAEARAPRDPTVQYELAGVYRRLGERELEAQARERHRQIAAYELEGRTLTERIASRPDDLAARLALARLHARHGATVEAVRAYRFLLLRAPDHAEARQEHDALVRGQGGQ